MNIDDIKFSVKDLVTKVEERTLKESSYFGVKCVKNPMDAWIYQELLHAIQPDVLIEIGIFAGGSTLYFAHLMDNMKCGSVIGIDTYIGRVPNYVKKHPRITLLEGDAKNLVNKVEDLVENKNKVMIIEDSSHTYDNTLGVLRAYNHLVTKGSYFIVEDTVCQHGLDGGPKPGPYEAVEEFMKCNDHFEIDRSMESFVITWNPKGFLRKVN